MENAAETLVLRDFFRELIACLGRVAARHQLPDDAVWEMVKGFDVLYQKTRRELGGKPLSGPLSPAHRLKPHPGIQHLLAKLDQEDLSLKSAKKDRVS